MSNISLILKAITFAAEKHQNQRRKNAMGTPYINHPLAVANYITSIGNVTDANVICAAVLHDTIEDTNTSYDESKCIFGSKIANIVMEVTDDKSLPKVTRKKLQIEHAVHISHEAKLVKLADKLSNLIDLYDETPKGWSFEVSQGYFVWSYHVVKNFRGTNSHLEKVLDEVFVKVITTDMNLDDMLEKYYQTLESNI